MNKVYRIDVELRGSIEILAADEDEARTEAQTLLRNLTAMAAHEGIYLREPAVAPRRVLEKGEG